MRKIDELANQKFNGDVKAAIHYANANYPNDGFDQICKELSHDEFMLVLRYTVL